MRFHLGAALTIGLGIVGGLAPRAWGAPLSEEQQKQVEQIVRDLLTKEPDVLRQALKLVREKDEAEAENLRRAVIAEHRAQLLQDPDSPVGGNPGGDVTIVEFFDYNCSHCKVVEPSLDALADADPKVRIVYKEFPILGPGSVMAARAAEVARIHGKWPDFHRAMMAHRGLITLDAVVQIGVSVGLDGAGLREEMKASEIGATLERNHALAQALGIHGTPTFLIGDTLIPGELGPERLKQLLADARSRDAAATAR